MAGTQPDRLRTGLKVLHVIPAVAARYGGPSRAVVEMCRALSEHRVNARIATTDADGAQRLLVPLARWSTYEGVPTMFFPRQWSEAFKYSRPLARWLGRSVRDFDVVHVHAVFNHSSLAAARACRRAGVPYVVRPLGSLDPWSLRRRRVAKWVVWNLAARRALLGAVAVHYTTAEERRLAEERLRLCRGVVIANGVDPALLAEAVVTGAKAGARPRVSDGPYVLALGRLHPKKALEVLLEAFARATANGPESDWRLVLAGDGDPAYAARLRAQARALGIASRVLFTGWVDGPDRVSLLRGAALLALVSHQENFGLSAVEALACGVPVLVSDRVNVAPDVQAAGAGWVTELRPESVARALGAALADPAERTRRGARGRELVRARYTWPVVARELVRLYETVAAQRSAT